MHIILKDIEPIRTNLMPLTLTRPCGMLPAGINDTIASRWQRFGFTVSFDTQPYLAKKYGWEAPPPPNAVVVPGHIIPDKKFADAILAAGEAVTPPLHTLAYRTLTDIFRLSKELITRDFALLADDAASQPLSPSCTLIGDPSQLFIAPGASVEGAMINVTQGPVYIGVDADVQECVVLRGPVAIGNKSRVRAGARLLPGTNLGPDTRVGGEISNTVFLGHANKQHDGFLGDAVIGQWVNIGAECVASNLKNDYSEIRLWNYGSRRFERTGLTFCGLIMGDHTKAAIDTTFNTATVVGVACNIHGTGFPRNFVASFSNGGPQGVTRQILRKVIETERIAMSHRNVEISQADIDILTHIFNDPNA